MNITLSGRTIRLDKPTGDTSVIAENRRAREAAWHVIQDWLPRTLAAAGMDRKARQTRALDSQAPDSWKQAVNFTLRTDLEIRPGNALTARAEEGVRKSFKTAMAARRLDVITHQHGRYQRDLIAEDIGSRQASCRPPCCQAWNST